MWASLWASRVAGRPSRACFDAGHTGYGSVMTALLVLLIVLALVFGIGAVLEGLAWLLLIAVALLVAAAWFGWSRVRRVARAR